MVKTDLVIYLNGHLVGIWMLLKSKLKRSSIGRTNVRYCSTRLSLIKIKRDAKTGVEIIMRACVMFGRVISGKRMLPYFIAAAAMNDPAPSFNKKFRSPCSSTNLESGDGVGSEK